MPLTPEDYAKSNTEHSHQVALFMWAADPSTRLAYPQLKLMFAIPNGGLRDKATASRLKAEGVKAGVPDIFLPVPRNGYCGLFIELKRIKSEHKRKGIESDDQTDMIMSLKQQGYEAAVVYGWEAARELICNYMDGIV